MLTSMLKPLTPACLLLALVACGTQTTTSETPSTKAEDKAAGAPAAASDDDLGDCAAPAKDPEVIGDGSTTLVRSTATTAEALDTWLAQRVTAGGPTVTLSSYEDLNITTSSVPLTICVFKTDPRPIPVPDNIKTVANGVRVFVQGPNAYDIDAIGDVDRLSKQLDTLVPSQ